MVTQFASPGFSHGRNGIRGKNNSSAFIVMATSRRVVLSRTFLLSSLLSGNGIDFSFLRVRFYPDVDSAWSAYNLFIGFGYPPGLYADLARAGR